MQKRITETYGYDLPDISDYAGIKTALQSQTQSTSYWARKVWEQGEPLTVRELVRLAA